MVNKNIVLIGFMGSGKSLCSIRLGDLLSREVISTDKAIEQREGKSIPEIFKEQGEAYFREVESKVIQEISGMTGKIIDTGGGVVLNKDNVDLLKKSGILIWLKASVETIWNNIQHVPRKRPLLDVEDPKGKIKELMEERIPFYSQADISLVTDGKSIEKICDHILGLIT